MKQFLIKTFLFLAPISLLLSVGLFLPPTPRASLSLLSANQQKDSLLLHTPSPRMIFVGGSNLSFGLNSNLVRDSLALHPINTAVHASIGIKYMLDNTLSYLQEGDVVVLAFEYQHFFRSYHHTSDELFRTVMDVSPEKAQYLSIIQFIRMASHIPQYTFSKLKSSEYAGFKESDIYSVHSFNQFGDVDAHWPLPQRTYQPMTIKGTLNETILEKMKAFEAAANSRGAKVYVTFPCLDEVTFNNSQKAIAKVEKALQENGFQLLGTAERYKMPRELMFNTAYHLTKEGVDLRTERLIKDFRKAVK